MTERLVAVLDGSVVSNVIVVSADWEAPSDESTVEYTSECPAGIGWEYDGVGFIPPKPYPSWILNNYVWEPPVPRPISDQSYVWDESSGGWVND